MSSKYYCFTIHVCSLACVHACWFTRIIDVLGRVDRIEQTSPRAVPHAHGTTDIRGDETEGCGPGKSVRSKRTFKMKKVWWADEPGFSL